MKQSRDYEQELVNFIITDCKENKKTSERIINNFYSKDKLRKEYVKIMKSNDKDFKSKEYNILKLKDRMVNSVKQSKYIKKTNIYLKNFNSKNIHTLDYFWTFKYKDGSRGILINGKYPLVLTKERLNTLIESIKIK